MLSITLKKPRQSDPQSNNYEQVITHLATHTLIGQGDPANLQEGQNATALDISQVCCYMCEKPLNNGMELCGKDGGSGKVNFWKNPAESDDKQGEIEGEDSMKMEEEESENSSSEPMENFMLLCGDCNTGLLLSLADGDYLQHQIMDGAGIALGSSGNPRDASHYLWPNQAEVDGGRTYTPDQYFVYVRKMGIVEYGTAGEVDEDDIMEKVEGPFVGSRAELVQRIFVEPNPALPTELWYKALNTIRLFRLNGNTYQAGGDFHHLRYRTDKAETIYDDMRLEGRNKAYDRANTALSQFKTVRSLNAGPEVEKMILSQQQVLMELNGYRSVWRMVFKDGGDEGGFSQIMNIPTPVSPVPTPDAPRHQIKQEMLPADDAPVMLKILQERYEPEGEVDAEMIERAAADVGASIPPEDRLKYSSIYLIKGGKQRFADELAKGIKKRDEKAKNKTGIWVPTSEVAQEINELYAFSFVNL